ncbi:helix-turn-helix domain-containing protein [Natronoarchaeum sp. GCM10025321]|uniref:helix-turn-helix domain-containing protein n=1 Tax=Natronoarchaeum sp. GCM10025321 TaxID=3252684 RepID=UPI00361C49B6
MATVMEFNIPAEEFPLGSIFETISGVVVELERIVPHDARIVPYFWVRGGAIPDIEAAFGDHSGVDEIKLVDSVDEEYLLRAEWVPEYVGVLNALAKFDIVVLSARGTCEGWQFKVRCEDRPRIREFHTYCQDQAIPIEVGAVHALLPIQSGGYELTDAQREALVLAYDHGYFDSPREASLDEIAAELDITQQSLSSRLRRGYRRLVGATLKSE